MNYSLKNYFFRIVFLFLITQYCYQANAANYYINSIAGNNNNNGLSKDFPWADLQLLNERALMPGDSILFAKGSSFNGGVILSGSGTPEKPIVITYYDYGSLINSTINRKDLDSIFKKYGAGPKPAFSNPVWDSLHGNIFQIQGSYYVIDGLYFHDNTNPPGSDKYNKNVQKMGVVYFYLGTSHNIVRHCEFFHTPVAIKIKGSNNLIEHNYFHDATVPMAQSWGPIAIMIVQPHNEICYNKIENYGSYGGPYGSDGGVVELDGVDDDFVGHDIKIHHNISINNQGFLEMAGHGIDSIFIYYNLSDDVDQFIGGGSMKNVIVCHNTIVRVREPNVDRHVFWTFRSDSTSMIVSNNIFFIAPDISVFGKVNKTKGHVRSDIGEQLHDHNLYYSPGNADPVGIEKDISDMIANPKFIDPANGNFRLQKNSVAINAATTCFCDSDLDGYPSTKNGKSDIGAYEY
ncbi:MAG: hypothetical protein LBE82_03295 [Chitinophagaceae bacterium]|jgi:hypothetical protein|nr:hypothetical protein [Chitinophagaceae bacterium]